VLDGDDPAAAEAALEALIAGRFGASIPVMARTAGQWRALIDACPFPREAEDQPSRLQLLLSKLPPAADAIERIAAAARDGEQARACGEGVAIFFPNGMADSKLGSSLIDRAMRSPTTARNWNTVRKLDAMARG